MKIKSFFNLCGILIKNPILWGVQMNLEKNKTYIASCSSLGAEGEGIVKIDGFTVFVEGMLPGEKAEILIVKLKKNYGYP